MCTVKRIKSLLIHWLVNRSRLNIVFIKFGFHGKIKLAESLYYLQQQLQLQTQQQNWNEISQLTYATNIAKEKYNRAQALKCIHNSGA